MPDAEVVITQAGESRSAKTDSKGGFAFSGLPSGSYLLTVSSPGWQSQRYNLLLQPDAAPRLDVSVNLAPVADIRKMVVRGTVRSRAGTPVRAAAITIRASWNPRFTETVSTDEMGRYELLLTHVGQYELRAVSRTNGNATGVFQFLPGSQVVVFDLQLD